MTQVSLVLGHCVQQAVLPALPRFPLRHRKPLGQEGHLHARAALLVSSMAGVFFCTPGRLPSAQLMAGWQRGPGDPCACGRLLGLLRT